MLVLDTSVLVYASGADHPLREPAVRLLRDVVASRVSATTTPEVLQQYAHVRARHRDRADAFAQAERFAELPGPLTVVNTRDVLEGLRIWSQTIHRAHRFANEGSAASVVRYVNPSQAGNRTETPNR